MKTGKTLTELALEIERQRMNRVDYLADTKALEMAPAPEGDVILDGLPSGVIALNELAHGQVASHVDIPKKYYDRMREQTPALLSENVNHWLHTTSRTCSQTALSVALRVSSLSMCTRLSVTSSWRPPTCRRFTRFERYCESRGHKKSTLIARLIREHLDREEPQAGLRTSAGAGQ